MHLYELIKMYGEGQGKDAMWKSVKHISDFVEKAKAALPEEYALLKKQVYADMQGGHYNEEFAMEQVQKMYYKDKSGNKHFAPYWTNDVVQKAYAEAKERIPECYNVWDFLVALNMVKADNKRLMDKWFPDMTEEQSLKAYVDLAVNYLDDEDAPHPKTKIWSYFN